MKCPNCNKTIDEDLDKCPHCNYEFGEDESTQTYLPFIESEAEEIIEVIPKVEGENVLVVKKGPNPGESFILKKKETTLGRIPTNNIFLNDITVSRKHAKITRDGKKFFLIDTESLNGTYLNRKRIEKAELRDGDEIQIGKFILVFLAKKK